MPGNDRKPVHQTPPSFRIIPWPELMRSYRDDVTDLVRSSGLSPTHLPDWLDLVFETRSLRERVGVLLIEDDSRIQGAIPYYLAEQRILGMPLKVLELGTNIVSIHASLIARGDFDTVWEQLGSSVPEWQIIRGANLPAASSSSQSLTTFADRHSHVVETLPGEQSPYLPIDCDWQSFIQGKSKKFRYKYRQRDKLASTEGELLIDTVTSSNFRPDVFESILEIEKNSWKAKYGLDIPSRNDERSYYEALLPYLADADQLHLVLLYQKDRAIAYSLCASHKGWFGQLKTSFDEA